MKSLLFALMLLKTKGLFARPCVITTAKFPSFDLLGIDDQICLNVVGLSIFNAYVI